MLSTLAMGRKGLRKTLLNPAPNRTYQLGSTLMAPLPIPWLLFHRRFVSDITRPLRIQTQHMTSTRPSYLRSIVTTLPSRPLPWTRCRKARLFLTLRVLFSISSLQPMHKEGK